MTGIHVVGISGSLSDESATRVAVETALQGAESTGATTELIDLRHYDLPVFDPDEDTPTDAERLTERIESADAILLGTPTYHGSFSGSLKNTIDYCGFDEFEHKTVGLIAVAGGRFPIPPLNHLREVCRSLNAWVLPRQTAVPQASSNIESGKLTDGELVSRLRSLGEDSVTYAGVGTDERTMPAGENVGAERSP